MKRTALLLAIASLAAAPMSKAADVVTSFDEATLDAVLAAVGATEITKRTSADNPARNFTAEGIKYSTALRSCKADGKCAGILIQCTFTGETFSTTSANAFNLAQVFASAAVTADRKQLYVGRITVALGGTTVANVVENFKVFFSMPPMMLEQLKKDGETPVAGAQPQATPAAAPPAASTAATAPGAGVSTSASPAMAGAWIVDGAHTNVVVR